MKYATRLTNRLISMGAISQQAVSFLNRDAQRCRKKTSNLGLRNRTNKSVERATLHLHTHTHAAEYFPELFTWKFSSGRSCSWLESSDEHEVKFIERLGFYVVVNRIRGYKPP